MASAVIRIQVQDAKTPMRGGCIPAPKCESLRVLFSVSESAQPIILQMLEGPMTMPHV